MKKIIVFAVVCLISLNAYPFWGHARQDRKAKQEHKDKKAEDAKRNSKIAAGLRFSEILTSRRKLLLFHS